MNHSTELRNEWSRDARGLRRHAAQPSKAWTHRYERRKVRRAIRRGNWEEADAF